MQFRVRRRGGDCAYPDAMGRSLKAADAFGKLGDVFTTLRLFWSINDNVSPGLIRAGAQRDIVKMLRESVRRPGGLVRIELAGSFRLPEGPSDRETQNALETIALMREHFKDDPEMLRYLLLQEDGARGGTAVLVRYELEKIQHIDWNRFDPAKVFEIAEAWFVHPCIQPNKDD